MRGFSFIPRCVLSLLCLLLIDCAEDIPEPVSEQIVEENLRLNQEISSLNQSILSLQQEISNLKEIESEKKSVEEKISSLEQELLSLEQEKLSLEQELQKYQDSPQIDLPERIIGKDGAPMVLIPAGEFSMGDHHDVGQGDEKPVHTVYLDAYYIDVHEVTNTQYAGFLNKYGRNTDNAGHSLLGIESEWCLIEKLERPTAGLTYSPKAGYGNHPVVIVNWYGAAAYTKFYGKRLPTEAEREKAARGGLVGKKYPWGLNDITHDDANYDGTGGRDIWDRKGSTIGTAPVGSFPPNSYGLYDMGGNVWEWCADWYDDGYYVRSPRENPTGPSSGTYRVHRGGAWHYYRSLPPDLRVASRDFDGPTRSYYYAGFRCVQDVTP